MLRDLFEAFEADRSQQLHGRARNELSAMGMKQAVMQAHPDMTDIPPDSVSAGGPGPLPT